MKTVAACLLLLSLATALELHFYHEDRPEFEIIVSGIEPWFRSGELRIRDAGAWWSSAGSANVLEVLDHHEEVGTDPIGYFHKYK